MKFDSTYKFIDYKTYKAHSFFCMGGLCEVLVETTSSSDSMMIFKDVYEEAKRLEKKYSRYRDDNIVSKINNSMGKSVEIDTETFSLLQFADSLHTASNGLFDITSGVLRKIWTFDGQSSVPSQKQVKQALKLIGWDKVKYDQSEVNIPKGWELDFGGLGKEYAVDSCCNKAKALDIAPSLINLGGDIAITGAKKNNTPWSIEVDQSDNVISLLSGGVATSGDKNRFILHKEKRLTHILNPKTGRPIEGAPKSVTVIANNCTEAGAISTISSLMGHECENFLKAEGKKFHVIR